MTACPVPCCPTCRVPEVDLHRFAANLEGGRVLLEHGGDVHLAGDKRGTRGRSHLPVGSGGGAPTELCVPRTGHREVPGVGKGKRQGERGRRWWCHLGQVGWDSVPQPRDSVPQPRAAPSLRQAGCPGATWGGREWGSGASVGAPLPPPPGSPMCSRCGADPEPPDPPGEAEVPDCPPRGGCPGPPSAPGLATPCPSSPRPHDLLPMALLPPLCPSRPAVPPFPRAPPPRPGPTVAELAGDREDSTLGKSPLAKATSSDVFPQPPSPTTTTLTSATGAPGLAPPRSRCMEAAGGTTEPAWPRWGQGRGQGDRRHPPGPGCGPHPPAGPARGAARGWAPTRVRAASHEPAASNTRGAARRACPGSCYTRGTRRAPLCSPHACAALPSACPHTGAAAWCTRGAACCTLTHRRLRLYSTCAAPLHTHAPSCMPSFSLHTSVQILLHVGSHVYMHTCTCSHMHVCTFPPTHLQLLPTPTCTFPSLFVQTHSCALTAAGGGPPRHPSPLHAGFYCPKHGRQSPGWREAQGGDS